MAKSELKGFYNLIVIALVLFFVQQQALKLRSEGSLVGLDRAWLMFNRHDLFPAWLALVSSSFLVVFYQKIKLKGFVPVKSPLDYVFQLLIFAISTMVCFERKWSPIPTGFFVIETLIIDMKIHSYIMANRNFTEIHFNQKKTDEKVEVPQGFPQNVTLRNFLYFLLVPTLVYELDYPRTPKIRPWYILEKIMAFVGLWTVLHVITSSFLIPVLEQSPQMTVYDAILQMILPALAESMLVFYIVFDVITNAIAELTQFGDREFYTDWWNSTTFDEWSRKWNKPVHDWLRKHVYEESIKSKKSKFYAALLTFFVSSLFHEYFMIVILRIFRPWLFLFQMLQIPLIYLVGRSKLIRNTRWGNLFFWFAIAVGPPLISVLYCREYYLDV